MIDEQRNPQKISKNTWFDYIEAWQQSGKTQLHFCKENKLSYGTFGYWRTGYLKQIDPSAKSKQIKRIIQDKPAFIPVKLPEIKPALTDVIQARFASGLTLALPLSMPTNDVIKLLQALEHHHAH